MTPITREQWVSVAKNVVFAGVSAYIAAVTVTGQTQKGAVLLGVMAALKVIEKLFTTA